MKKTTNTSEQEPLFSILKGQQTSQLLSADTTKIQSQLVVVIGNPQCGKSTMISQLCGNKQTSASQSVGLLYSYYRTNVAGNQQVIQLYEVSGNQFKHLNTLPVTKSSYEKVTYAIVVDLADNPPDILTNLNNQLQELRSTQEKHLQQILSPQQYQDLEQKQYQQIDSHQDRLKMRPFPLPLVIVGWKYDLYQKNLDVEVRKQLSKGLRYLAHTNNATLVYAQQNDISLLKQAISAQNAKVNINDHMKLIYVAKGADSIENMGLPGVFSATTSPVDALVNIIKQHVVINPNPQKKKDNKGITNEEFEQFREDRIDRIKNEKQKELEVNEK